LGIDRMQQSHNVMGTAVLVEEFLLVYGLAAKRWLEQVKSSTLDQQISLLDY